MYVAQPGHIDHIKRNNAGTVYKLIDKFGPISRIELSKRSQLAPASITKITRELLEAHLIKETEYQEPSSRGRPAIGLVVDNEGWQFLSMRLGRGYLTIALHDLGGDILIEERVVMNQTQQDEVLDHLLIEINQFFQRHSATLDRVTSVAISLPGLVDSEDGIILQMPHYDVRNLELGKAVHQATGLPVFVGNDTRSWALAEKLFGHAVDVENAILVSVHNGVGAGIMVDGTVLQRRVGNIGEIGHIQIKPYGKRCHCGNYGCLETEVSLSAALEKAEQLLGEGHPSVLQSQPITIESLCNAAVSGDGVAQRVIIELGQHLGRGIAILVNLFNPQKVMIGSELNRAKTILYPAIEECVKSQALPSYGENLQFMETRFYTQGTMAGAALVKQALYDGSLLIRLVEG